MIIFSDYLVQIASPDYSIAVLFLKKSRDVINDCVGKNIPRFYCLQISDNFKKVNDVHGHAAGDAALQVVRDILIGSTRPTDLVARLGGDEFAIWLEEADRKIAVTKARLLIKLSEQKLRPLSGSMDAPLGLSIGIAVHDSGGEEALADLMVRADQAMYEVKKKGKGGYDLAPREAADFSRPDTGSKKL